VPCLWYFQWFTVLFLTVTVAIGLAFRAYRARTAVAEAPEAVAA
jgi:cell division protein FtsL